MSKGSEHDSDSEVGEVRPHANRIGAVLCPAVCALLIVGVLALSYVGTKMAYEQYDAFCAGSRFGVLYVVPNMTIKIPT